jgi:hypothetical protein
MPKTVARIATRRSSADARLWRVSQLALGLSVALREFAVKAGHRVYALEHRR